MRHGTVVQRLIDAFNGQRVEDALSLLHPDVEFRPAGVAEAVFRGHDGFRRLCAEIEGRLPRPHFTALGLLEAAGTVVMPARLQAGARRGPHRIEDEPSEAVGSVCLRMREGLVVSVEARFEQGARRSGRPAAPRSRRSRAIADEAPIPAARAARG